LGSFVIALVLSFLLVAYIIIPGIIVRRLISLFVPLKKPQWNRTEELTSAVARCLVPFAIALILVRWVHWFGHHPFPFDDASGLRWSDYKTVFSASYSEKIYEDYLHTDNDAFWQTALRVCKRQSRLLAWYYVASGMQAAVIGLSTYFYGDLRRYKPYEFLARKFVIPNLSEWHVMLTPFTHPRKPKRTVRLEILTPDQKLYRGTVGDYHIDKDSALTGILLEDAYRFDRRKYEAEIAKGQPGPTDSYWRKIPGHALYLLSGKIHNLNISYPSEIPMEQVVEQSLKGMKIAARVSSQPQEVTTVAVAETPIEGGKQPPTQQEPTKNFVRCPHCASKGRVFEVQRAPSTPLVSRSDGSSFHLYLLRLHTTVDGQKKRVVAFFRYALDKNGIANGPTVAILEDAVRSSEDHTLRLVEDVADELAAKLRNGETLAGVYEKVAGKLTPLPPNPPTKQ
jgi:hypothetical protein